MSTPQDWCWEPMPPIDGWFAVIRCWELAEGMWPGAAWATAGKIEWPDNNGLAFDGSGHAGPFATKSKALEWASYYLPSPPIALAATKAFQPCLSPALPPGWRR